MNSSQSPSIYSIGAASKITSLSHRQIRYYEQQGLINPSRTKGNQRLYSKNDLEKLRLIKFLLQQGIKLDSLKDNIDKIEEIYQDYKNIKSGANNQVAFERNAEDRDLAQFFRKNENLSLYPIRNQEEIWRKLNE